MRQRGHRRHAPVYAEVIIRAVALSVARSKTRKGLPAVCVWPCIDFMTAATTARAAALAAAVAAFTAILYTRAALDLAAPTIARLLLRLFLAMGISFRRGSRITLTRAPPFRSRNSVKPVLYRPHVVSPA
jgi:hypothetical protein